MSVSRLKSLTLLCATRPVLSCSETIYFTDIGFRLEAVNPGMCHSIPLPNKAEQEAHKKSTMLFLDTRLKQALPSKMSLLGACANNHVHPG